MKGRIMRTTGYSFDGYYVDNYIDVISEEVIFRSSVMKAIGANFKNMATAFNWSDTEVKGSSELIANGKEYVLEKVYKKAKDMGGNAILGMQFQSSFGDAVIRVAVSGTVVHITPDGEKRSGEGDNVPVKNASEAPVKDSEAAVPPVAGANENGEAVAPLSKESHQIVCPKCGMPQRSDRLLCMYCGVRFKND